ncbi:MAG: hypothetical protein LBK44_05200, partial [Spirochaetales bacterium]|nr:hypothetical protein [Spirochaetales bacterium]
PGINDDEGNIRAMAEFIRSLSRNIPLEVLPYHEFGRGKLTSLDRRDPLADCGIARPGKESVIMVEETFRQNGVEVIHS